MVKWDTPPLTNHAEKRWRERCHGLDVNVEWYMSRKAGKSIKRHIRNNCPGHASLMTGYHGFFYAISKNDVVFVCSKDKIITVFRLNRNNCTLSLHNRC